MKPTLSEGGLIMCGKISEGDIKFLDTMKLVPPKDLGSIIQLKYYAWQH